MEDVGELDRVVISLLQELDHSRPAGITIAATNRPDSLDEALLRRFDCRLEFPLPNKKELASFTKSRAKEYGIRLQVSESKNLARGLSYADIDAGLESIRRQRLLAELRRSE
jgi:SpoVK/Ycf46/Vps4 family AAA+-type ATPase